LTFTEAVEPRWTPSFGPYIAVRFTKGELEATEAVQLIKTPVTAGETVLGSIRMSFPVRG
jgi:hypothetical protein